MGNSASISVEGCTNSIRLHWNGGVGSVRAFVNEANRRYQSPRYGRVNEAISIADDDMYVFILHAAIRDFFDFCTDKEFRGRDMLSVTVYKGRFKGKTDNGHYHVNRDGSIDLSGVKTTEKAVDTEATFNGISSFFAQLDERLLSSDWIDTEGPVVLYEKPVKVMDKAVAKTALIVWETLLEGFILEKKEHKQSVYAEFKEANGMCETRDLVIEKIAPAVELGYSVVGEFVCMPFDFEFVPTFLEVAAEEFKKTNWNLPQDVTFFIAVDVFKKLASEYRMEKSEAVSEVLSMLDAEEDGPEKYRLHVDSVAKKYGIDKRIIEAELEIYI